MNTTLNKIKHQPPCATGWEKLLANLGKTKADDEPLSLMKILESNGIADAVWALRCFDYLDYCLFLADLAESVLHIYERENKSQAPRNAIEAIRQYKLGNIKEAELRKAADDAYVAYTDVYVYADVYTVYAAAYAAYAAAADVYVYAVYADVYVCAAADAAACADVEAACAIVDVADAAREKKWEEIEALFIKHFGEK